MAGFPPHLKTRVVELVRSRRGPARGLVRELAERFGIAEVAVWRWVREAERAERPSDSPAPLAAQPQDCSLDARDQRGDPLTE